MTDIRGRLESSNSYGGFVQTVNFSLLKPEEIQTLAYGVLPIVAPLASEDPFVAEMKPKIDKKTTELSIATGNNRGSKCTPILTERDNTQPLKGFGGFFHLIPCRTNEFGIKSPR